MSSERPMVYSFQALEKTPVYVVSFFIKDEEVRQSFGSLASAYAFAHSQLCDDRVITIRMEQYVDMISLREIN